MEIWQVLGIEPTADRAAITAAYREKLSAANPEDDPEAFKTLRAAYEQALRLARQAAATEGGGPQTEAERWQAQLDGIYQDIRRRRDPAAWQALLDADFCTGLATRVQARDLLLRYLMGHFFLPQEIWLLLDDYFGLCQNAQELYQSFSRDFIDNAVVAGCRNLELLPYDHLEGENAAQCDGYLRAYAGFRRTLNSGELEQAARFLQEMQASGARHPYTLLCEARLALMKKDLPRAQECVAQVLRLLPADMHALLLDAQLAQLAGDFDLAEGELRQVLAEHPDVAQAKFDLAGCLHQAGRLPEAKKIYLELSRALPYHPMVHRQLDQLNRDMLPGLEQRYADDPADTANAMELAWCCHQLHQTDRARRVVDALPQTLAGTADYENLAAKVYLGTEAAPQALLHAQAWEQALRVAETPDTVRIPEALRLQAQALLLLGRREESRALAQKAAGEWPEDAGCQQLLAQQALQVNDLPRALACIERACSLAPADSYSTYLRGVCLFRLRRLQEAYQAFEGAMQQAGRAAGCILYQCRILIETAQWDDAKKLLEPLAAAGFKSSMMHYCCGRLAEHEKNPAEAEQHYTALLPACRGRDGEVPDCAGEVFFRLICLQYKTKPKDELLALAEEGLQHDTDSISLMDMKADLLRELNRIPESIAAYRRLCAIAPRHRTAHESLGRLLQFRLRDFAGAARAYETQLEIRDSAVLHNLLGLCLQELGRFPEAEAQLKLALQAAPGVAAFHANLAELYALLRRDGEAIAAYQAALQQPLPRAADRIRLRRQLSRVYARMGRPAEAAALLQENMDREYVYADGAAVAECWARAGQTDQALAALEHWKRLAAPAEGEYLLQKSAILRQRGDAGGTRHALLRGAQTSRACLRALSDLYCDEGKFRRALPLYRRLCADQTDSDYLSARLARCLLLAGQGAAAAQEAARGLTLLEQHRSMLNQAMYHTRRAELLLCMGQHEQAGEALDKAEACPLCSHCCYGACKDAMALRALLYERLGRLPQAAQLCRQGMAWYPDETDFSTQYARVLRTMSRV